MSPDPDGVIVLVGRSRRRREVEQVLLVYDEHGERLNPDAAGSGDQAAAQAIRTAEDRDAWPAAIDWDEGPDPVRFPEIYDDTDQDGEHDAAREPFDLDERAVP